MQDTYQSPPLAARDMRNAAGDIGIPEWPPGCFDPSTIPDADTMLGLAPEGPPPRHRKRPGGTGEKVEVPATRVALKIARAIDGRGEVRLLEETKPRAQTVYLIETALFHPFSVKRVVMHKPVRTLMNKEEAHKAFDDAVAEKYPPEKLKNGRSVAIHQLLK